MRAQVIHLVLAFVVAFPADASAQETLQQEWTSTKGTPSTGERPSSPGGVSRIRRRGCPAGKTCRTRQAGIDPRLSEAEASREPVLATAARLVAIGRHAEAAQILRVNAETMADPVLYLAAAAVEIRDGRAGNSQLNHAIVLTEEARQLVLRPVGLRVAPDVGLSLVEEGERLVAFARQRREYLQLRRRGRAELAVGGVLLASGLAGFSLIGAGGASAARVDAAAASYKGEVPGYREQLHGLRGRAEAMVAVGLLTGLIGSAIGIPLTVVGSRRLRRNQDGDRVRSHFRIAPGLSGIALSGRF